MIRNYIRLAIRNIRNYKLVSLTNMGSLAVAMAAVIGILLWIEREVSFDTYHKGSENTYLIKNYETTDNQIWVDENSPYPLGKAIIDQIPQIGQVTQMQRSQENAVVLRMNNTLYQQRRVFYVDSNWFKVFDYKFVRGNAAYFFSFPYSVLLTASKAKEIFGSVDVIGQVLQIDTMNYRVGAIVEDNPSNSSFQVDVMIPMAAVLDTKNRIADANYWPYSICKTFVKIGRTSDIKSCEASINKIYALNSKKTNVKFELLPLEAMHFSDDFNYSAFKHGSRKSIVAFFVLGMVLLLIACINYVNLAIAILIYRLKEICIRKISGARPIQLFFQVITESSVTAILSLILSVIVLKLGIPLLSSSTGTNLKLNFVDLRLWVTLFSILAAVIAASGFYPALLLSSIKPNDFFKGLNFLSIRNSFFKKGLLTVQFSLAIFMIIATIVVHNQLEFIQDTHSHLDAKALYTVQVPEKAINMDSARLEPLLNKIKYELLANSAIKSVCRTDESSVVNFAGETSGGLNWNGKRSDFEPTYVSFSVEPSIKEMLNLSVIHGRWFNENSVLDRKNIVLNETAVKEFNLTEPVLGKRFNDGQIIGVVKDFMFQSMRKKICPVVIRIGKPRISSFFIEANPEQIDRSLELVNSAWRQYFPGQVCNLIFLKDELKNLYLEDRKASDFTTILSGLAILLCCVGLLGMTIFMVHHRKKEIGIRKLLGSSVSGIVLLVSKEFIQVMLIAIVISSPIAWWIMNNWLQNYAYRIDIGFTTFLIAGLLSLFISLITISLITIKSATGTQLENLRSE